MSELVPGLFWAEANNCTFPWRETRYNNNLLPQFIIYTNQINNTRQIGNIMQNINKSFLRINI
jgi:hypothetical protein